MRAQRGDLSEATYISSVYALLKIISNSVDYNNSLQLNLGNTTILILKAVSKNSYHTPNKIRNPSAYEYAKIVP